MMRMYRLDGTVGPLLQELCRALDLGERLRPGDLTGAIGQGPSPDMLLGLLEPTRPLGREVQEGAEHLLLHVLERPGAPSAEDLTHLAQRLASATDAALSHLGMVPEPLPLDDREAAFAWVARLCREIGLERRDLDIMPGRHKDGGEVVAAAPVRPVTAHVWLLGRLFERVESLLLGHPLLDLEHMGSSWWFASHSSVRAPEGHFPRSVREDEWSLVDRESLVLGAPMLDAFLKTKGAAMLPPRQRKLAEALQASFPGAFVVRDRTGNSAVFEEIVRGRRIEVDEHSAEAEYETGWIGLGRVCAFDGPVHIRTPGMVFLPPEGDQVGAITRILAGEPHSLPLAIRVEILLCGLLGETELPRPPAPAASPREARALLTALDDALETAGLAEEISAEEAGPELASKARASGLDSISFRSYDLDAPMSAWMKALMEYSRSSPVRKRGRRKPKKRRR